MSMSSSSLMRTNFLCFPLTYSPPCNKTWWNALVSPCRNRPSSSPRPSRKYSLIITKKSLPLLVEICFNPRHYHHLSLCETKICFIQSTSTISSSISPSHSYHQNLVLTTTSESKKTFPHHYHSSWSLNRKSASSSPHQSSRCRRLSPKSCSYKNNMSVLSTYPRENLLQPSPTWSLILV